MNLPKAFFTSRVTEALASLAVHVTSAQNIAASLKPIKTAALDLEEEEKPRPIITLIKPRTTNATRDVQFTISGKNLAEDSVKSFELFLEDNPSVYFKARELRNDKKGGVIEFTASVDLDAAPSGSYEVRITDKNDTPHLPGFIVEIEAVGTYPTLTKSPRITESPTLTEPPTITDHPQSQEVNPGGRVTLTVVASGSEPFSIQWLKDGKHIVGAKGKDLEICAEEITDDQANYSVVVGNSAGFAVSDVATLMVNSGRPS